MIDIACHVDGTQRVQRYFLIYSIAKPLLAAVRTFLNHEYVINFLVAAEQITALVTNQCQ